MNKKLKFLKLGVISATTVITIPVVTSVSSYYALNEPNNSELIQIKINGKTESFFSVKEAQDYILRNNIADMNQEVMIGNRRYLDKNSGMLNTNELYKYVADKEHIKPAYKMLNGHYTDSKDKALKTYIGRSHLVSQYYDFNGGYFEGTLAGSEKAKDSIRKRQLDKVVPFNNVDLGVGGKMHINPFNKDDQKALKSKVLELYTSGAENKITETYLFPTNEYNGQKDTYIGIEPSNYSNGLTYGDLVDQELDKAFNDYKENHIRFKLRVTLPFNDPYEFDVNGGHPVWYLENKNTHASEVTNDWERSGAVKVDIYSHAIVVSNISLAFLRNDDNKKDLAAFMDHGTFWDYFNEIKQWDGSWKASLSAGLDPSKTLFGRGGFHIMNTRPKAKSGAWGFDIAVNQRGTAGQTQTSATFERTDNNSGMTIPSLLNIKNDFMKIKPNILKGIKSQILRRAPTVTNQLKKQMHSEFRDTNFPMLDTPYRDGALQTYRKALSCFKEIKVGSILTDKINPLSQDNDVHKILLLDGTPIMEINNKKVEVDDSKIIPKIGLTTKIKNNRYIYIYRVFKNGTTLKQSGVWNSITKFGKIPDLQSKQLVTATYQLLKTQEFKQLKYNDEYKKSIPIIFYKGRWGGRAKDEDNIVKVKLGKILSDDSKNVSINKLGQELIFINQGSIDKRKDQIASKYFQPPLVHVIYNDNDEVIDEFQQNDSIIKFDDKEAIKHNANAILSDYLRKDTSKAFIKIGKKWSKEPINNKLIMVYNINWKGNKYTFESFENVQKFIKEWIETNSHTVSERIGYD